MVFSASAKGTSTGGEIPNNAGREYAACFGQSIGPQGEVYVAGQLGHQSPLGPVGTLIKYATDGTEEWVFRPSAFDNLLCVGRVWSHDYGARQQHRHRDGRVRGRNLDR